MLMQPARDKSGDAIKFDPFIPPSTEELDALIPAYKFVEFIELRTLLPDCIIRDTD